MKSQAHAAMRANRNVEWPFSQAGKRGWSSRRSKRHRMFWTVVSLKEYRRGGSSSTLSLEYRPRPLW